MFTWRHDSAPNLVDTGHRVVGHDLFISYSTKDKPTADAVCNGLESAGIRCWMAPRDILPGQRWASAIVDAINDSKLMVIVLSASSNASEQVLREVERCVHAGIPLVPFRIEEFELASAFQYYLGVPHWLDAMTGPLEEHIQRLVQTTGVLIGQQVTTAAEAARSVAEGATAPAAPPVMGGRTPVEEPPSWVTLPNVGPAIVAGAAPVGPAEEAGPIVDRGMATEHVGRAPVVSAGVRVEGRRVPRVAVFSASVVGLLAVGALIAWRVLASGPSVPGTEQVALSQERSGTWQVLAGDRSVPGQRNVPVGGVDPAGSNADEGVFNSPGGVALGPAGGIFIADTLNHRIQRIESDGRPGERRGAGDLQRGDLQDPAGLVFDNALALFIVDQRANEVVKVPPRGAVTR